MLCRRVQLIGLQNGAMSTKTAKMPEKLEQAIEELEKLVVELESPDLALEKSIELFERGSQLSRFCYEKLGEAEKKVEVLVKKVPQASGAEDFERAEFDEE